MLPFSLAIFGNFSLYHPLSILWTTLFTIFYPLSLLLHVVGFASLFDGVLQSFIDLARYSSLHVDISYSLLGIHVSLSLLSIFYKKFVWMVLCFSSFIFIYSIYHVT